MGGNASPVYDENLPPNLFLHSFYSRRQKSHFHPPACLVPAQLRFPLRRIPLDVTPLVPPSMRREYERQIITLFGLLNIYLPGGAQTGIRAVNSAAFTLTIWSVTCCVLSQRSRSEQAAWRDTHSGSKRTWRLWFEIESERRAARRHMTDSW